MNPSPSFQAILQDLRQQRTGNPATDRLLSLLLTLLTGPFNGLADLIGQIKSGQCPPHLGQTEANPAPRPRSPRPQHHRWPAAMRLPMAEHGPADQPSQRNRLLQDAEAAALPPAAPGGDGPAARLAWMLRKAPPMAARAIVVAFSG